MLTSSPMKSILNPKFSVLSPHLPKIKITPFISWAAESLFRNHPTRILRHLHLNRNLQMEASGPPSGEIHVIVGPMFAGKTTTLLRRIQLENDNGR